MVKRGAGGEQREVKEKEADFKEDRKSKVIESKGSEKLIYYS